MVKSHERVPRAMSDSTISSGVLQAPLTPTRGGGTPRAQTTIELMTILAVALVILAVLISFTAEQVNNVQKQRAVKTAEQAVLEMVNTANELYTQGPGASRYLQLTWPDGVSSSETYLLDNSIVVSVYGTTITGTATPPLSGVLPSNSGLQYLRIRSFDGYVVIGDPYITMSPPFVLSTLGRDTNSGARVTLTNLLQVDSAANTADLNMVSTWNHTDVNLIVAPSIGTLFASDTFYFDVNFFANSSAVGSYAGKITVIATFPSRVETLVLPIQANVNVSGSSNLITFPTSISLSTFGADTNSLILQVCNVGSSDLKSVSISPTGNAGSWVSGFADINTLAAQTCQPVDVNVNVPDYPIGSYTGSLSVSDYTGANTASVPLAIDVRGMNSVFSWDWSTAFKNIQSIIDFTLSNSGRKPITITHVTLRNWGACDSSHSNWTSFQVNNTTRFFGSSIDGNTVDVTDFNIPVLTSYTDNLLTFDGIINDENESFVADVNFSDGTQYTSSAFGTATCPPDITAPATITNLTALPGPEPQTIELRFTAPGDDNFSGEPLGLIFKYSASPIITNADFNNARTLPTGEHIGDDQQIGGNNIAYEFSDINIGALFYFSVKAYDEVGLMSGLSNSPSSHAWNRFSFSGGDFNFTNASPATTLTTPPDYLPLHTDVNQFDLNIFSFTPGVNNDYIQFRITNDLNSSQNWTILLDLNDFVLKRAQIWHPNLPGTFGFYRSADFDQNYNYPFTTLSFLDGSLFGPDYNYGGARVNMSRPNHFYLEILTGISDFNIVLDNIDGNEGAFTPL